MTDGCSLGFAPVSPRRSIARGARWPAALVCGCGGDSGRRRRRQPPPPPAQPEDFPERRRAGRSPQLRAGARPGRPGAGAVGLRSSEPGENRFGFGLFDRARKPDRRRAGGVYVAPVGGGQATGRSWRATSRSRSSRSSRASRCARPRRRDVASTWRTCDFPKPGDYEVLGVVELDDRLVAAPPASGRDRGEAGRIRCRTWATRRPRIHTPDQGRRRRRPRADRHPRSRPRRCTRSTSPTWSARSRSCSCSPRRAVPEPRLRPGGGHRRAGQGRARRRRRLHPHGDLQRTTRSTRASGRRCATWKLPTEPWVFAIDRNGKVAARLEGAFSARELDAAHRQGRQGLSL